MLNLIYIVKLNQLNNKPMKKSKSIRFLLILLLGSMFRYFSGEKGRPESEGHYQLSRKSHLQEKPQINQPFQVSPGNSW